MDVLAVKLEAFSDRRWLRKRGFNSDPTPYDTCAWFMLGQPDGALFVLLLGGDRHA